MKNMNWLTPSYGLLNDREIINVLIRMKSFLISARTENGDSLIQVGE